MRIANLVSDSIVDGPGLRLAVFTQGCPHRCPGCHNPETHDSRGGQEMSVAEVVGQWRKNPLLQGLTLTGGEPFAQAADCALLAQAAHQMGWTVWTYTGYLFEDVRKSTDPGWQALLRATDVLVDGPFVLKEKTYGLPFRGSRNQRVIRVPESLAQGEVVLWSPVDTLAHFTVPES